MMRDAYRPSTCRYYCSFVSTVLNWNWNWSEYTDAGGSTWHWIFNHVWNLGRIIRVAWTRWVLEGHLSIRLTDCAIIELSIMFSWIAVLPVISQLYRSKVKHGQLQELWELCLTSNLQLTIKWHLSFSSWELVYPKFLTLVTCLSSTYLKVSNRNQLSL